MLLKYRFKYSKQEFKICYDSVVRVFYIESYPLHLFDSYDTSKGRGEPIKLHFTL